jgi:hypothetical protein
MGTAVISSQNYFSTQARKRERERERDRERKREKI